jgi:hypothetical protein
LLYIYILTCNIFFLTGYVSWTWAEPNGAVCGNTRAKWRPPKKGAKVRRQPRSTLCDMFIQPFYFVSYYFLELNMMISFLIFRRHVIAGWGRNTGTILRPTWISIWICGWRQDRLVDLIKIGCTDSPTLQTITCGRFVVSQPLGALNQYRTPSLRRSWPWNSNISNSRWIMNNSASLSWTWDHIWVEGVCLFFGRMVLGTTSLLLLLQLRHCSSLIFFWKHFKIVINIWMNII